MFFLQDSIIEFCDKFSGVLRTITNDKDNIYANDYEGDISMLLCMKSYNKEIIL